MRAALQILTEELRRLKTTGLKTVAVSEASLRALRRAVTAEAARAAQRPPPEVTLERSDEPTVMAAGSITLTGSAAVPGIIRPVPTSPATDRAASDTTSPASTAPTSASWAAHRSATAEEAMLPAAVPATILPPAPVLRLPAGEPAVRLGWLREQVEADPVGREYLRPGKKPVLGEGDPRAKLLFIGDAPGAEEELVGRPFVGQAGQLLDKMIKAMGLSREQVYLASLLPWRPPMPTPPGQEQLTNRSPTVAELAYALPYLRAQIEIVGPHWLVALGGSVAQALLGERSFKKLEEVRGRWHEFDSRPVMVTYHPSYILRHASNRSKRMIWEDLLQVMTKADLPISAKQRSFFLEK